MPTGSSQASDAASELAQKFAPSIVFLQVRQIPAYSSPGARLVMLPAEVETNASDKGAKGRDVVLADLDCAQLVIAQITDTANAWRRLHPRQSYRLGRPVDQPLHAQPRSEITDVERRIGEIIADRVIRDESRLS